MKSIFVLLIAVLIVAIAAGIIVVQRQGTHACVSYYNKDGSQQLNHVCK